jgi:hypothetical protein
VSALEDAEKFRIEEDLSVVGEFHVLQSRVGVEKVPEL